MKRRSIPFPFFKFSTTYAALIVVSMVWGGTFVAGRFLASDMSPVLLASIRFVLASAVLLMFLLMARVRMILPKPAQIAHLALLGFFGIFAYNICFFLGLHLTPASRASLIVAMNPACIALASYFISGERLSPIRMIGVLICIAGAGLVIVSRGGRGLGDLEVGGSLGDVFLVGCVISWVIYSVCSIGLTQTLGPFLTVTYSIWFGTAMLCCAALVMEPASSIVNAIVSLSLPQIASLLYLGAIGSALAYVLYYEAIRRVGAMNSGTFIALNPITAVLFGWLIFDEAISLLLCVGGIMAVYGIYLCNRVVSTKRPMTSSLR